jgi:histidinol-phosphatase
MKDFEKRRKVAAKAVAAAIEYQHRCLTKNTTVTWKADQTPVTEVDRNSEEIIRKIIHKKYPGDAILGEETGLKDLAGAEHIWIVDPLDGTNKFIRGLPFFGPIVGCAWGRPGSPEFRLVAGSMGVSALKQIWSAQLGGGAFRGNKRISLSTRSLAPGKAWVAYSPRVLFRRCGQPEVFDTLEDNVYHNTGFLDVYSYCLLADGKIDAVVSAEDKWWDISAAILIIREAGGKFTSREGPEPEEHCVNIAAAPGLHESLKKLLKKQ